ncbi:hypothetical protein ANCCAN_01958 [Ancylostoma caninum]|uniref:Uncharacterized protein n=1 Tax=Ancylostoma caninum TaxID=29170 RepID=A0A368H940_ANCCA|nr:hypothetical protein ANCCAN_01958 [Ancylostoma caninum]
MLFQRMDVPQWKTVPFADALVVPYLAKAATGTSAGAEPAAQLSALTVRGKRTSKRRSSVGADCRIVVRTVCRLRK